MIAGTLLHYEDHNLKNDYFLDPQWLAKRMADIIQPEANFRNGMLFWGKVDNISDGYDT